MKHFALFLLGFSIHCQPGIKGAATDADTTVVEQVAIPSAASVENAKDAPSPEPKVTGKIIHLPRQADGSVYKPAHGALPGDIIELEGHYKLIFIENVHGTAKNPIIIRNKGKVTISGYLPYCFIISGKHFVIDGTNGGLDYGIHISGFENTYAATGIALGASSNYEIKGVSISQVRAAFIANPIAQEDMSDIYIHHNRISNLANPDEGGRSEGFYFGNTGASSPGKFRNCRIEDNILEDLTGDGIQVAQGDFIIRRNTIRNWAKAQLLWQRTGILVGNETTSVVEDNILEGGMGAAYQNFGGGNHSFRNNLISNIDISGLENEDIVYIAGRSENFAIDFSGNRFDNCKPNRKLIYNATSNVNTKGSKFYNNRGVGKGQTFLNGRDKLVSQ